MTELYRAKGMFTRFDKKVAEPTKKISSLIVFF